MIVQCPKCHSKLKVGFSAGSYACPGCGQTLHLAQKSATPVSSPESAMKSTRPKKKRPKSKSGKPAFIWIIPVAIALMIAATCLIAFIVLNPSKEQKIASSRTANYENKTNVVPRDSGQYVQEIPEEELSQIRKVGETWTRKLFLGDNKYSIIVPERGKIEFSSVNSTNDSLTIRTESYQFHIGVVNIDPTDINLYEFVSIPNSKVINEKVRSYHSLRIDGRRAMRKLYEGDYQLGETPADSRTQRIFSSVMLIEDLVNKKVIRIEVRSTMNFLSLQAGMCIAFSMKVEKPGATK